MTGVIVRLVVNRGFGFLTSDEAGFTSIFFHANSLQNLEFAEQLKNLPVEFDLVKDSQGRAQATNVRRQ